VTDDPMESASARRRGLALAATLGLALGLAGIGYTYSDRLVELLQSLTNGTIHAQGHIRY
jgi:hypothetical protein